MRMRGPVCSLDDIPAEGALAARDPATGDELLLLLGADGQPRAYLNVCPHAGRPLDWAPGKFLLQGHAVVCAAHGASFARDDGACLGGPCRGQGLRPVPVALCDGAVWVLESGRVHPV